MFYLFVDHFFFFPFCVFLELFLKDYTNEIVTQLDPHLNLIDDSRLHATSVESSGNKIVYGSEEDELAASSFLATLVNDDKQLKEFVISLLMEKYEKLPEVVSSHQLINVNYILFANITCIPQQNLYISLQNLNFHMCR